MATLFRDLSYRYQCLRRCDRASGPPVSVGSEARLGQLAWENLTISAETKVLDFCCGSRQTTQFLVLYSQDVTGIDAAPLFLQRARKNVLSANYVEAFAESMPFPDCLFDRSAQQGWDARNAIGAIATNLWGIIPRHQARGSIHFGRFSSTHKSSFLGRVGGVCWQKWDGDRTIPKKIGNQNFMLAATFK